MNVPKLRFPEFMDEWEKKKLGEVTEKIQDGTHFSPTILDEGTYKYITSKNIRNGYMDLKDISFISDDAHNEIYRRCDVMLNDVLITKDGANAGNVCLNELTEEFSLLSSVAFIRADKSIAQNDFIYQYISSPLGQNEIQLYIAGQAITRITLSKLKSFKISIPSLREQTSITTFLTAVDVKLNQLKQKKTLLEQYKNGVMQKIFTQEIRFKDDNGKEYPKWEKKKLGEISKFRRGSFPQPYGLEKWYDDKNGSPFVQVFDVDDNMKLKNDTKRRISNEAQKNSVFAEKGSIVLTLQGSIGRIAITQYESYIDRTLLLFESFKIPLQKHFFMYSVFLLFEKEKEKAPGGTIKTITKEVLTDFTILVPHLIEQTKIANFLSAIDEKINYCSTQIEKTALWKKGLLQKMFV